MSELALLRKLQLRATALGMRLFRNNTGALQNTRGEWVHYGLCRGSSDLIGWTPVTITPAMVGRTLAVFTAVEAKTGRVPVTVEQRRFLDAVNGAGGVAVVARKVEDLDADIGEAGG